MKTTKRLLAGFLAAVLLMGLVGCAASEQAGVSDAQSMKAELADVPDVPENENEAIVAAPSGSAAGDVAQQSDAQGNSAVVDLSANAAQQGTANEQTAQTTAGAQTPQNSTAAQPSQSTGGTTSGKETPSQPTEGEQDAQPTEQETPVQPTEASSPALETVEPDGEYNEGIVLVKVKNAFDASALGTLDYTEAEPLYTGSKWYTVRLRDAEQTVEAVTYLSSLDAFEGVDYDYVMSTGTVDVSCNPDYGKSEHHQTHKIPDAWDYSEENGKRPGGSSDVVVAVIDTGVDYTHMDLRNNIWVNTAEIPGNGIDDDGNGYIDDVYGWDFVGNDNEPLDDNGHGTHVAGIIAAENNDIGGVGIAYNCKVMVLKAGNSSGYFNNSDIAEAIQYAYMNGASVINMSFGGSSISIAVEDALENAYNACVLVAAAGNDGACNNLSCKTCDKVCVSYPAALPYVIGVMSANHDGSAVSSFSNYDHYPYDSVEYEVYAVGEAIPSCWPGNKYASLNGTSMAAPIVSGIAALLRSYYSDRDAYSTKFIQSQIVNTGTLNPYNFAIKDTDSAHSVTNVYEALTQLPKPEVNLYDYSIDDSTSINSANNGNGIIDAGETVRLYFSLHNRGGVASNVNVSIDTKRSEGLEDPYFTFVNSTLQLSDIGTYSVRESGEKYFEIVVSSDCPNDYLVNFNLRYTYTNGMDEQDHTTYSGDGQAQFNVSRGFYLPSSITEDTTYTADRLYIVGEDVIIPEGVTVTFEAGCEIQFYDDRDYYNSPAINVYGTLIFAGTREAPIHIAPNERHTNFAIAIRNYAQLSLNYVEASNLLFGNLKSASGVKLEVTNSVLRQNPNVDRFNYLYYYSQGRINEAYSADGYLGIAVLGPTVCSISDSYLEYKASGISCEATEMNRCYVFWGLGVPHEFEVMQSLQNSVVYTCRVTSSNHSVRFTFWKEVKNNYFLAADENTTSLAPITFKNPELVENNTFSSGYQKYAAQVITNYYTSSGVPIVDVYGSCSDYAALYPHISQIELFNADGEAVTTLGKEPVRVRVRVTFSRPMDTSIAPSVTFGTVEPYADYRFEGAYVSETVWEGTYTLKAQIENGLQQLVVKGARAADGKTVFGEYQPHEFTIDTTAAMSMNLVATASEQGIELMWNQDDYATLMGYNLYRADSKDGNYVKINPSVLLPTDSSFLDDNAEPGKTYWYTFTVVLSDFTESAPAGKVSCAAIDTLAPTVYHTPVNQGYVGNNLVISCTASDNMQIVSVTLFYRTVGAESWKTLNMSKVNDKYSATVFGSDLTLAGIEYYIEASDGVNTVSKGSADAPYTVVIKDASAISRLGDVDGNGSVTTKDALMLMQCLNGDLLLSDDAFKRADLNGDGQLSSAEALRILQYVNGKVTTLEM